MKVDIVIRVEETQALHCRMCGIDSPVRSKTWGDPEAIAGQVELFRERHKPCQRRYDAVLAGRAE